MKNVLNQTRIRYENVVMSRWYYLEFPFSLGPLILLKYCKMLMPINVLVFSYLIVSREQLLIQHDTMNTKVGCHLCTFQILGGCQGRRTGVGVTTVSNSLILGGWVTKVLKNGDKK